MILDSCWDYSKGFCGVHEISTGQTLGEGVPGDNIPEQIVEHVLSGDAFLGKGSSPGKVFFVDVWGGCSYSLKFDFEASSTSTFSKKE